MGSARHPALATGACVLGFALLAILASGCGSSDTESPGEGATKTASPPGASVRRCSVTSAEVVRLRVNGIGCDTGGEVVTGWISKEACAYRASASRASCSVGAYRCLAAAVEHNLAVSCGRPGRSVSFVLGRR